MLVDPSHEVTGQYGVWVADKNYGTVSMGIEPSTFEIVAHGKVGHIMCRANPRTHADAVFTPLAAQ